MKTESQTQENRVKQIHDNLKKENQISVANKSEKLDNLITALENSFTYINPFNFEVDDIEYLRKFHELPVDTQNDIKLIMTRCKNIMTEKNAIQNMINDEYEFFKSKNKYEFFKSKKYINPFNSENKKELPDWSNIDKLFDNILNPSEPFIKEANELKALSKDISNVKEPTEFEISEGLKENKSMQNFDKEVNDIVYEKINDDLLENRNKNKFDTLSLIRKLMEIISLNDLNKIKEFVKKSNVNISNLLKRDVELFGYNSQYDFVVFEIINGEINWNISE